MTNKPTWFAYARQSLSRAGDLGDSVSVADQFRTMEEHAERVGARIVARYHDQDVSGATEARDGFDKLLHDVKTVKPDAVVIRDISRLARDTRIFLTFVDTLKRSNVELLSATESMQDKTLVTIMSAISERERLALAGRIAGGVREHARRGKTHGSPAYGYRRLDGVMTIEEPEAAVVRFAYERFAAGDSVRVIIEALNADPLAPKPPETPVWRRDTVARMLRRSSYAGDAAIAARRDISGRAWPAVVTRDAHPAIVGRALWDACQRRFAAPRQVVRMSPVSPLSGFLRCAHCHGALHVINHARPDRPADQCVVRCATVTARSRGGGAYPRCPGTRGSRALHRVESVIVGAVTTLIAGIASPQEIRDRAETMRAETHDDAGDKARQRLAEIERRRSRLLDAYETGALDLMTWTGRDRLLGADADALRAIVAAVPAALDVERLVTARDGLAAAPVEGLDYRALLTELGARVVVDLDDLSARVEIVGDYAALFPGHAAAL